MAKVQRLNVILDVDNKDVDHYLAIGYNLVDAQGKIIKETMPSDVPTLQGLYREHKAKIEALEAEVKALKLKLKEQESKKAPAPKEEVGQKPKQTRKKTTKSAEVAE